MSVEHSANAGSARGFVPDATGARWTYEGPLTFAEAGAALDAARVLALPREGDVDLTGVDAFDSAAVAVLLALARRAAGEGRKLRFAGLPVGLRALVALYGVEEMVAG